MDVDVYETPVKLPEMKEESDETDSLDDYTIATEKPLRVHEKVIYYAFAKTCRGLCLPSIRSPLGSNIHYLIGVINKKVESFPLHVEDVGIPFAPPDEVLLNILKDEIEANQWI